MVESAPKLKLIAALVCDDTRREDNGKEILIGVYTGAVIVPELPAALPLSLWIYFQPESAGHLRLGVRVLFPERSPILEARAEADINTVAEPLSLTLPRMPLNFKTEGLLTFEWRVGDGEWEPLAQKMVLAASDKA